MAVRRMYRSGAVVKTATRSVPRVQERVLQAFTAGIAPRVAVAPSVRGYGGKAPMSAHVHVRPQFRYADGRPPLAKQVLAGLVAPRPRPVRNGDRRLLRLFALKPSMFRMCARRAERRQVLFASRIAGKRGLGRNGVRRSLSSEFTC